MNRPTRWLAVIVSVLNVFVAIEGRPVLSAEPATRLPAGVVLEEACPDTSLTKVVLIAGSNFFKPGQHEYIGGCAVLMDLLRQTPGVFPVLALDWPRKAETFAGAKSVVFYFDGGDKHAWIGESRRAELKKLADAGVGLVCFHQGVDVPKDLGPQVRDWMGASFEKGFSQRAHWVAEFKTFPEHPVCRGVAPFRIDDGWLYKLRFVEGLQGVTPLLRTVSPKAKSAPETADEPTVSWVYERLRRRAILHLHRLPLAQQSGRRGLPPIPGQRHSLDRGERIASLGRTGRIGHGPTRSVSLGPAKVTGKSVAARKIAAPWPGAVWT